MCACVIIYALYYSHKYVMVKKNTQYGALLFVSDIRKRV